MKSNTALDLAGGALYLFHKVFSDLTEWAGSRPVAWKFRLLASTAYLIGIFPVVAVFLQTERMIFALIELGGIPAVAGAVVVATRNSRLAKKIASGQVKPQEPPRWLSFIAVAAIPVGMWLSVTHHSTLGLAPELEALAHRLEIVGSAGFLIGTFLQMSPRRDKYAYLAFLAMNVATLWLFHILERPPWVYQQAASIVLILDAVFGAPLLRFGIRFGRFIFRAMNQLKGGWT